MTETPRRGDESNQPSQKIKSEMSKDYSGDHQCENSPTSSLAGPHDSVQVAFRKSASGRVDIYALIQLSFIDLLLLNNMPVY